MSLNIKLKVVIDYSYLCINAAIKGGSVMLKHSPYTSGDFLYSLRDDAIFPPDDIRKEVCELISSISDATYQDCYKRTQNLAYFSKPYLNYQ